MLYEVITETKKDGTEYYVNVYITLKKDKYDNIVGWSAIRENITSQVEVENLSKNLEKLVDERTLELTQNKQFLDALLDSQEQIVITTDGQTLRSVITSYSIHYTKLYESIDSVYTNLDQKDEILTQMQQYGYVENLEQRYKTNNGKEFIALLSVKPIRYKDQDAFISYNFV